jgi:hypothetical protein
MVPSTQCGSEIRSQGVATRLIHSKHKVAVQPRDCAKRNYRALKPAAKHHPDFDINRGHQLKAANVLP